MEFASREAEADVVLVGAGIMSATLAVFLKELDPRLRIIIYERLDQIAAESSHAWNNAGTGHSALCELNYTPMDENGHIKTEKALKIFQQFETSKQFWAYLVGQGYFESPRAFIRSVPHMSWVKGAEDVAFLKKRFEALQGHPWFKDLVFSDDPKQIKAWVPLLQFSDETEVAATFHPKGTDVNFGQIAQSICAKLTSEQGVEVLLNHEVRDISRLDNQTWLIKSKDQALDIHKSISAKFVFLGAGGGTLPLLNDSDIPEADGYGGFPVSGQWLVCQNPEIIAQHHAKVYSKAQVGTPPMSVPHLDTRFIDGKKELIFGPFAGFSTKFLKEGSSLDLLGSITADNLLPMLSAGIHNVPLTKYLIEQVMMDFDDKMNVLRAFIPDAQAADWELAIAGQRVQVIKKDEEEGGVIEFGTDLVTSADGTLAALLGASPGASTSVSVILELLTDCFPDQMKTEAWQQKLQTILPAWGLDSQPDAYQRIQETTHQVLELHA